MRGKLMTIFIVSLIGVLLIGGISYAVGPAQQAKIFAEQAFTDEGWRKLCEEDWKSMGFTGPEQAQKAYLGDPIPVYQIDVKSVDVDKDFEGQAKQIPVYIFPVMADGEIITDIYVHLKDGEWDVLLLGGHISRFVYEVAEANGLEVSECKIIRAPIRTIVIAREDGKEVGIPYPASQESMIMTKASVTEFKLILENEKKYLEQNKGKKTTDEDVIIGSADNSFSYSFKQNQSVIQRLAKFVAYKFCMK